MSCKPSVGGMGWKKRRKKKQQQNSNKCGDNQYDLNFSELWIVNQKGRVTTTQTADSAPSVLPFFWSGLPLFFFFQQKNSILFFFDTLEMNNFKTNWKESPYKENKASLSFSIQPCNLCEAFLVEAIKFAIWDLFPLKRHKSAKN